MDIMYNNNICTYLYNNNNDNINNYCMRLKHKELMTISIDCVQSVQYIFGIR